MVSAKGTSTTSWGTTTTSQAAITTSWATTATTIHGANTTTTIRGANTTTTIRGANTTTSSSSRAISTPTAGSQAASARLGFAAEDFNEAPSFGESNEAEKQQIRVLAQAGARIHQKRGPAEMEEEWRRRRRPFEVGRKRPP